MGASSASLAEVTNSHAPPAPLKSSRAHHNALSDLWVLITTRPRVPFAVKMAALLSLLENLLPPKLLHRKKSSSPPDPRVPRAG